MRIQVTGARGMLGRAVVKAIEQRGHDVIAVGRSLTLYEVDDIRAPVVINCAGIVKQRNVTDREFIFVNAYGPHFLEEVCNQSSARLIHVSTDCVFSGPGPHNENSTPDGKGIYSISKLAGEVTRLPHLTVRTSFVGSGPRGLLADLMANKGGTYRASRLALWTGHLVDTVADALVTLAERPEIYGLLHIPAEEQTRAQLVRRLSDAFNLNVNVVETNEPGEDRRLTSVRWARHLLPALPSFGEQLSKAKYVSSH